MAEAMFLGLRLTKGVSALEFYNNFGVSVDEVYGEWISKNIADGFINMSGNYIRLTDRGMDFANIVMAGFV